MEFSRTVTGVKIAAAGVKAALDAAITLVFRWPRSQGREDCRGPGSLCGRGRAAGGDESGRDNGGEGAGAQESVRAAWDRGRGQGGPTGRETGEEKKKRM